MELRQFGNTALSVSTLGLGTAEIGFERADDATIDTLIGCAADAGVNVIDTAAMYADAEASLGRHLHGSRRNQFLVFTKCGRHPPVPSGWLGRMSRKVRRKLSRTPLEWRPEVLTWNIEQSLKRLRTDCLDLVQLHTCSAELVRRGDVIEVLERARSDGKTRYIGFSGDGEAARVAVHGGRFDAIQLSVNVLDQEALHEILPKALARGMGVIAKRPLANVVWRHPSRPTDPIVAPYWDRLGVLAYPFLQQGEAIAGALGFTLSTGVHTAIVGTKSVKNMHSNIAIVKAHQGPDPRYGCIRSRWNEVAAEDWAAQT